MTVGFSTLRQKQLFKRPAGALSAHAVIRRGSERRPASPLFLDNVFALALGVSRLIASPDCGQLKALTDYCDRRAEKASHKTLARSSASGELVRHEPDLVTGNRCRGEKQVPGVRR